MREDSSVIALFMTLALAISCVFATRSAFGAGADNLSWELRWRGLDAEDRARISMAARSKAALTAPEEVELAAGLRRRDLRRRAYVDVAALPVLTAAAALALAGMLSLGAVGMPLAIYSVFVGLWSYLRVKEMSGKPRAVTSPDAGL
jgi:hypothetical protein